MSRPGVSLVEAAAQAGWGARRADRAFLADLDERLRIVDRPRVAVLVTGRRSRLSRALRQAAPRARISRHRVDRPEPELHAGLAARGPFDLIVDDTRGSVDRSRLLREVFLHTRVGGLYVVRSFRRRPRGEAADSRSLWETVGGIVARGPSQRRSPVPRRRDTQVLASSFGRVVVNEQHLSITNVQPALAKLHEEQMDEVLRRRTRSRDRLLHRMEPVTFTSRATLAESASDNAGAAPTVFAVPPMSLREYADVTVTPGQVAFRGNLLLPDTYRHNRRRRLKNLNTVELAVDFALPKDTRAPQPIDGAYFYLDSEFRGHFGHAVTEQLSRLWGWPIAKQMVPELKAVMLLNANRELAQFEQDLYAAAGIAPSDILFLRAPARLERLVAATPMFSQPEYVHPDIVATWNRVSESLAGAAPPRDYPKRVFCARRIAKRPCHNASEVESLFAAHGFAVIYPEDFTLPEQAAIFREAEVVAGYAGSALFSACFSAAPKRLIMISSEAYTARNEYLLAAPLGHHLDVLWCRPDIEKQDRWTARTMHAGFTVDLQDPFLRGVLAEL